MLNKVKLALRITTDAFDAELNDLIAAGKNDLAVVGICPDVLVCPEGYPLVARAIITYCKLHFGEPADPERLQASYDAQKGQLQIATGYTVWTDPQ